MLVKNWIRETQSNSNSALICSLYFQQLERVKKNVKFKLIPNQDLFQAVFSIKDGGSCICSTEWRTDARDSRYLTLERA